MNYLKLTNAQLDLATSYQRWQMEVKGDVLVEQSGLSSNRVTADKAAILLEIENFNLNEQR